MFKSVCNFFASLCSYIASFTFAFLLVVFVFLSIELAIAQVNPGTPSFSAYDSSQYDTVNLQNLNVVLNIPIMSKSGAFPFDFRLTGGDSFIYSYAGQLYPGITAVRL